MSIDETKPIYRLGTTNKFIFKAYTVSRALRIFKVKSTNPVWFIGDVTGTGKYMIEQVASGSVSASDVSLLSTYGNSFNIYDDNTDQTGTVVSTGSIVLQNTNIMSLLNKLDIAIIAAITAGRYRS